MWESGPLAVYGAVAPSGGGAATTWNPADKTSNITLSSGNLVATLTNNTAEGVRSIGSISGTKQAYWEVVATTIPTDSDNFQVGIANATWTLGTTMINVATAAEDTCSTA